MSSDFDPYYLWLGIPPQEQPPNHYRLLGIAAFESNASVIDSAASRQSTYLHSVAAGPQRQASQKLLTEIAGARRALLNAESKLAYDAELKTRLESAAPKLTAPPIARPVGVPVGVPVAVPIAAPIAAPVAAPIAAPVAIPVAAPIAAPIVTPFAIPVAAPIAAPVVVPIAAPVALPFVVAEASSEPDPLANLFGVLEEESSPEVEPSPAPAKTISPPSSSLPPGGSPTAPRSSKRLTWMAGGGVALLVLILGIVFRPKGNRDEAAAPPPKKSTAKKTKSPTPDKDKDKDKGKPPQSTNSEVVATNASRHIRYIRIELPRKGVLTLAEVETLFENRNVAAYGATAEQSTTEGAAAAALAIDGNTSGKAGDKTQSQTKDSDKPWWKLDLGGAYPLEKIVIHNGTDPGMSERLAGFTLLLLDRNGRTVVELKDQPAPNPRSEFVVSTLKSSPPASATPGPAKSKPRKTP